MADTFWASGFWATGFWADGFWAGSSSSDTGGGQLQVVPRWPDKVKPVKPIKKDRLKQKRGNAWLLLSLGLAIATEEEEL